MYKRQGIYLVHGLARSPLRTELTLYVMLALLVFMLLVIVLLVFIAVWYYCFWYSHVVSC